jgi:Flp pilus assembly protein TadG
VVEFAIVAPVFFLFIFGIIEFGRMVMVQQVITNASREGARMAILSGSSTSGVTTAVTNYLSGAGISGATVAISPDPPSSATYGSLVTVTVSIPFRSVSWIPSPFFLGSTSLKATCSMRTEQSQSSSGS